MQMKKPRGFPCSGSPNALPHIAREPPDRLGIGVYDALEIAKQAENLPYVVRRVDTEYLIARVRSFVVDSFRCALDLRQLSVNYRFVSEADRGQLSMGAAIVQEFKR